MRWLGVDTTLLLELPLLLDASVSMTTRDRIRAVNMLGRLRGDHNVDVDSRRRMLQLMLMLNTKLEMQALEALPGGMCAWLRHRVIQSC